MKILIGKVLYKRMNKTAVILTKRKYKHIKYNKYIIRNKKYHIHDEYDLCKKNDIVYVYSCNPISKTKFWKLLKFNKPYDTNKE